MSVEGGPEVVESAAEEVEVVSAQDVLLNSPSYAAWRDEDARLKARLQSVRDQWAALDQEERDQEAKWQVVKFNAVAEGKPIPPKPEPVDKRHLFDAEAEVMADMRMHVEQRLRAIVAAMEDDGVLEAVKAQETEDLPAMVPLYEALLPFVQRAAERASLARQYEGAKASLSTTTVGAPRVELIPAKPGLFDLLQAAKSGRSLLEPAPVPVVEGRVQRVDEGYGLKAAGKFREGYEDNDRPAPPPIPLWMNDRSRGVV